jgi:hypothetical protein
MANIIICADGTCYRPDQDIAEDFPTNVLKLAHAIKPFVKNTQQHVFYDRGWVLIIIKLLLVQLLAAVFTKIFWIIIAKLCKVMHLTLKFIYLDLAVVPTPFVNSVS